MGPDKRDALTRDYAKGIRSGLIAKKGDNENGLQYKFGHLEGNYARLLRIVYADCISRTNFLINKRYLFV